MKKQIITLTLPLFLLASCGQSSSGAGIHRPDTGINPVQIDIDEKIDGQYLAVFETVNLSLTGKITGAFTFSRDKFEDEMTMQLILKKYLSTHYQVEIFKDGVDAMAFLQQGNVPDLIISDLNTPVMGGLALTKQLRASDFFNAIPIIILSGEESGRGQLFRVTNNDKLFSSGNCSDCFLGFQL